jgi:hypothetical protein
VGRDLRAALELDSELSSRFRLPALFIPHWHRQRGDLASEPTGVTTRMRLSCQLQYDADRLVGQTRCRSVHLHGAGRDDSDVRQRRAQSVVRCPAHSVHKGWALRICRLFYAAEPVAVCWRCPAKLLPSDSAIIPAACTSPLTAANHGLRSPSSLVCRFRAWTIGWY